MKLSDAMLKMADQSTNEKEYTSFDFAEFLTMVIKNRIACLAGKKDIKDSNEPWFAVTR